MATMTSYDRSQARQTTTHDGLLIARLLCLSAVFTGLVAVGLLGAITVSGSAFTVTRVVLVADGIGFGWCSISFLCAAVVAAASAA